MPSLNPFSSRSACTLFEIRLDNDFIVFRGTEHESAGQQLRGTIVLCLSAPVKVEDVRLRLAGTLRLTWTDYRVGPSGVPNQKIDRTIPVLEHRWPSFVTAQTKNTVLAAGNYEWPFEFTLPGNTVESVEGIPEASITYRLKATVARGKLSHDYHAYKHLRIIRTLEPTALEFLHAMSVENTWPNKVDYSIVLPQKAVVFGANVSLEMRFTPLLKGLQLGRITAKMVEIRECSLMGSNGTPIRGHRVERDVMTWKFDAGREEDWQDVIGETGQDGWVMEKRLSLPKKLRQCIQDLNHHGIKVRHKIKLTVALINPDGHTSELRATLPISIFISPNMPLDEQGNIVDQSPGSGSVDADPRAAIAPPGYGEHVLDQLYDDVDMSGFRTPDPRSGISTPYMMRSRAGSSENLASLNSEGPVPATLSSMLLTLPSDLGQSTLDSRRPTSLLQMPPFSAEQGRDASPPLESPGSAPLSRVESPDMPISGRVSPEHIDLPALSELNKVPSYATALRTPARSRAQSGGAMLPGYLEAVEEGSSTSTPATTPGLTPPVSTDVGSSGQYYDISSATVPSPMATGGTNTPAGSGTRTPDPEHMSGRETLANFLRGGRSRPTSGLVQRGSSNGGESQEESRGWHFLHGRERVF